MLPLTLALVDFLSTAEAQAALQALASQDLGERASMALLARLRRRFAPDQAAALLDQARLRRKAGDKFPHPERLLFTDDALQQASSRGVAIYRATQFARALGRSPNADARPATAGYRSLSRVADLGCGIGADTIALAEAGLAVLAVERDPIRARLAAANIAALGLDDHVQILHADWMTMPLVVDAAFVDPSRRAGEQRVFRLADMDPPITAALALLDQVATVAVKTLPGIADVDIPERAEVEFISERGRMKEALLRFGELRTGATRRATLLPGPYHLDSNAPQEDIPVSEPLAYFYEPDPAVIRATLVKHLATQLRAAQIDPTIAYLTGSQGIAMPFARCWSVLRHGPFHLKTLNQWLRDMQAGGVVVKKRGSAIDPDGLRRSLKTTPGGPELTVFATRLRGRPWMVVGAPLDAGK